MLKLTVSFCFVLLLSLSPSFAGENQKKLRNLKGNISTMYDNESYGSPYSFVDSQYPLNDARMLLNQMPIQNESINLSELPDFNDIDRVVNGEELAGLFIPVAEALLAINPIGVNESLEALREAMQVFDIAVRNLPVFGEENVYNNNSKDNDEVPSSEEEESWEDDGGMIFYMDDDCEDYELPEGNDAVNATVQVPGASDSLGCLSIFIQVNGVKHLGF